MNNGSDPKEVEYYAAQVNAWFNTKFEHDKSLLTLSAGGVGLLITLLSTTGVRSIESLILYILALLAFIICLGALLWIFKRNAKHLEDIVKGCESSDFLLIILDNIAISSFLIGVLFSSTIGISTAVYSYSEKERLMAEDKKTTSQQNIALDSINDFYRMAPPSGELAACSVQGISRMSPSNTNIPTQTTTPIQPNTSSAKAKE
jgi:hypothetical protein